MTFGQEMKSTRIVDDGDVDPYPPDDYTGEWLSEWPNGQLKFLGCYINGESEGEQICYWDNGEIAQRGKCVNGRCVGMWKDYREDGSLVLECEYHSDGDFTKQWFDSDGAPTETQIYKGGIEQKAEQDAAMKNQRKNE